MTDGLLILRAMLDLTRTALTEGDQCVSSQRTQRAGNPDKDCFDAWGGVFALSDTSYIDPARAKLRTAKRRTNASLIYRRTKNLRAVQILLGHTKTEGTLRYLGIDVDDALETADQTVV